METRFTLAQLADPATAEADSILRACVHCGFCTATCPTYLETGDERDGPRGRIWLIREFLETGEAETAQAAQHHLDRCLTCRNCETTCPSGVRYGALADIARAKLEPVRAPSAHRMRSLIMQILLRPRLFRLLLRLAPLSAPVRPLLPKAIRAGLVHRPAKLAEGAIFSATRHFKPDGATRLRVALLTGCTQQAIAPNHNEATIRLLTRLGVEVVVRGEAKCCGSLPHHMGDADRARAMARASLKGWAAELDKGLDAVVVNTSGCGPMITDYGHLLPDEPHARTIASLAMDVSTFLARHDLIEGAGLPDNAPKSVALHLPCTLQHGLQERGAPEKLLRRIGLEVRQPANPHLCCGAAGPYSLFEPDLSEKIGAKKAQSLTATGARVTVSSNFGCMTQLDNRGAPPSVHLVEMLDWATGGPVPPSLASQ